MPYIDTCAPGEAAPVLSIIYVNWNSMDYLLASIRSVCDSRTGVPVEIIVVDNASPEGRLEELLEAFPLVRLIRSVENLGFARANNLGFAAARGKYILFLNPDTQIIDSALNTMLTCLTRAPNAGIVGCKHLKADSSLATNAIDTFPTILNQILTVESLRLRFPGLWLWNIAPLYQSARTPVPVDVISGACMMMKRETFEAVGMLSECYYMYAEDVDLNYKISRAGYQNYYVGQGQIVHYGGGSSTGQPVSQWATIMKHRAMERFFVVTRGRVYAIGFRIAIAIAAAARLGLLGFALPFARRPSIASSAAKWFAVMRWAVGFAGMEEC